MAMRVGQASSIVPGGQWEACGLGPGANDTAGGQFTMLTVSALLYGASFTDETRIESDSSQDKACECDRDLRAVVLRRAP